MREDGGAVGDADVQAGRETGEGVADECVRGEGAGDDPRESVAPLGGSSQREAAAEDGDEGEDAEPAVALERTGAESCGFPVVSAIRRAAASDGSEPRSSASAVVAAGSRRRRG